MPYTSGIKSSGYPRYGTVINVISAPINILKSFTLAAPPAQSTADGYPNGTLSSTVQSQGSAPDGYYNKLVLKWNGQARWDSAGTSAIIYANTGVTVPGISNSCVSSNLAFTSTNTNGNRVVFKHGSLITGVSGGGGSAVVLSLINTPADMSVGQKVKISVGVSSNLANGPNSDGSWTLSATGANSATLANSTGVTSPTVTGAGGPDVQSEMVFAKPGIAWAFNSGQTYTNFNSAVFVKLANESAEAAGKTVDPDYIAQLQTLRPSWLRMMDISGVQANWETDFSARTATTYISWPGGGGWYNSNYWVGTITNTSDALTCSAPSLTSTGAYKNGEIVQGTISATNTTGTPTLNVNGRGAKRIMTASSPFNINFPSPAGAAGQTMQYTFSATWFNGGTPYVFSYTTTTTGHFGDDTSTAAILAANVCFAMAADATLNGNVGFTNSGGVVAYPLTQQKGAMTITYSGTPSSNIKTVQVGALGTNATFQYNYVLDAWLYRGGGLIQSVPLEYMVELCNSVGASLWYTWPINTSSAYVTAFTNYVATNLNSNLRFGTEVGNEMWNTGLQLWNPAFSYGWALGLQLAAKYQNGASYSWTALKTKQYGTASIAAWTGAGRSRSSHYILAMSAQWDIANTNTYEWAGAALSTSNTTYATYGGIDGAAGSTNAASDYTASPNRPIDIIDGVGIAPYWGSDFLNGDYGTNVSGGLTSTFTGTTLANDPFFTAANKWAGGNTSGAYDDLYNQFYANVSLGGPAGGLNLKRTYKDQNFQQIEGILRGYDASHSRPTAVLHYEGGPQFGVGNINNGTNDATTDVTNVTTALTNGGFSLGSYANASTASAMATAICGMVYNFKFSTQFYNLYRQYMLDMTTVHSGREACASQYGYGQSQWGLFPKSWTLGASTAYSSYQAVADFNSGL